MTLIELDEIKNNYKVIELAVDFINPSYNISRAKHLDNSRYIVCTLTENGIPRSVKATEAARIRLQKPDKTYVYNDCNILDDGRVFITLTEQILAVCGNAICDIQLTDNETGIIYSTKNFIINIDKSAVDNSIIASSNEFDALNNLITTNKRINDELKANEEVRRKNEDIRIENEVIRGKSENDRCISENERNNAEIIRIDNENIRITNEISRQSNEAVRQIQETDRENNSATAILNAEAATKKANDAADYLQAEYHNFILTKEKDIVGGVAGLDENKKISLDELYEASTTNKGVTQLTNSVTSTSVTTAATPNSVKTAYDKAVSAESNANYYTDTKIANLINGAPSTLDTLGEIADAMTENVTVVEALNSAIGNKVDKEIGKGLSSNDYTTEEKTKLAGIYTGAEINQNAFSNVLVGTTTISADSKTDTITLVAGDNITITPDAVNDKITISSTGGISGTTYTAGDGISISDTTISNSGVRSITTGSTNGTISVNTNGTNANISVKGLGSAAYTDTTDYALAGHTHSYLPLSGGTMTGSLNSRSIIPSADKTYTLGNATNRYTRLYSGTVELYSTTPLIDFHFDNSTEDYTSRIIESSSGTLTVTKNLTVNGTLNAKIWNGASGEGLLQTISVSFGSRTINSNAGITLTQTYTIPNGYSAIGIIGVNSASTGLVLVRYGVAGDTVTLVLRNITTSSITATPTALVLLARNSI